MTKAQTQPLQNPKHLTNNAPPLQGILLVNKPKGKTSFYLVKVLRKITNIKKIGHAGTLDPFATGVMIMLVGKNFTTKADEFLNQDKSYLATLHLGKETDTHDIDGIQKKVSEKIPSTDEIQEAIAKFQGSLMQTPPMFSAKKVKGKKLYQLARQGIEIEREPKEIHVSTKLVDYNYPLLTLEFACSKGTYIRSLAHDIGKTLETGAFLEELTRLKSGIFCLEDCLDFDTLNSPGFNYAQHLKDLHGNHLLFR